MSEDRQNEFGHHPSILKPSRIFPLIPYQGLVHVVIASWGMSVRYPVWSIKPYGSISERINGMMGMWGLRGGKV